MDEPRSRHIPLIFTGPLIHPDWRGRRVATIGNHHDVPATILDELGFSATPFTWSKDLLAEQTPQFAYYSNENGLGWITPEGAGFYRFARREWKWYSGTLDSASTQTALGYLQTLYNDFLAM